MYRLITMPVYEQATSTQPEKEHTEQTEPKKEETDKKKKEVKQKLEYPTPKKVAGVVKDIITNIANSGKNQETVQKNESTMIKTFDQFVNEAKKEKWIADVDMKKGALRKEMGKKKEEKISAKDIAKSEAGLKKKDKDKKKPGLQLDKKDAKTHKRNVLAKNLMKASGAMNESKSEKIKGIKSDLVKIHEVVERMIKQTTAKK